MKSALVELGEPDWPYGPDQVQKLLQPLMHLQSSVPGKERSPSVPGVFNLHYQLSQPELLTWVKLAKQHEAINDRQSVVPR